MQPFLGEIRVFGYGIIPRGWAACNGALLPISQNTALYSLLGVFYGGDGRVTFALPDLRGAAPTGMGSNFPIGNSGGVESVTLTLPTIPAHIHFVGAQTATATVALNTTAPAKVLAVPALSGGVVNTVNMYSNSVTGLTGLEPNTIGQTGSGVAHNNMPPFLTLNVCISLQGIFPSRS